MTFTDDGIAAIQVFFVYEHTDEADPGKPIVKRQTDGLLTKPDDVLRWRFDLARDAQGRHIRDYRYKVDVLYTDGSNTDGIWQQGSSQTLLVTPAAMGAIKVDAVLTAPANWSPLPSSNCATPHRRHRVRRPPARSAPP